MKDTCIRKVGVNGGNQTSRYVLRINFIPIACVVRIHDIKLHHSSRSYSFLVSLLVFVYGDVFVYSCTTLV